MHDPSRPIDRLGSDDCRYIQETGKPIIVTDHGEPAGVLLSQDAYSKLLEEAQYLREAEMLRKSGEDVAAGRVVEARQGVLDLAKKHGIDLER